ncbi:hypothetical protein C2845_PM01G07450 [Panicum miliaceum]|uniref:Uncharacterized protein n=1 Tax=Panicum miliaceum TaxID=4540 RepID=A0A3L6TIH8_PANMI|nr:hypothetical protein C2845_PM01G07450 [Panicum miliaceum]
MAGASARGAAKEAPEGVAGGGDQQGGWLPGMRRGRKATTQWGSGPTVPATSADAGCNEDASDEFMCRAQTRSQAATTARRPAPSAPGDKSSMARRRKSEAVTDTATSPKENPGALLEWTNLRAHITHNIRLKLKKGNDVRKKGSPSKLMKITEILEPDKKKFSGLLEIKSKNVPEKLTSWLIKNFNTVNSELVIPSRGAIKVDDRAVHRVFGIPIGQMNIDYEKKSFAGTFAEFYEVFEHEDDQKAPTFAEAKNWLLNAKNG